LESIGGLTFDRCHFKEFGGSGLVYETVYNVENPDYNVHMDILQELNFQLKSACESQGIGFAFPTRTVHLFHENSPPA
jgi:small-conductance mechanosensitive channel